MDKLTREYILGMKSEDLDEKVIRYVMKIPISTISDKYPFAFWNSQQNCYCIFWKEDEDARDFCPSVDISAAWLVHKIMLENRKYANELFKITTERVGNKRGPLSWILDIEPRDICHAVLMVMQ